MRVFDLSSSIDFVREFWSTLDTSSSILITSHKNPDDDSFSSVLSMFSILKTKYAEKKINVTYSGTFRNRWETFQYSDEVLTVDDLPMMMKEYDAVIVLDVTMFDRVCSDPEGCKEYTGKKICIDHHRSEHDDFDFLFVQPNATSTAELIYRLFCAESPEISQHLCESLLLGILGDTSWFSVNMAPDHAYILSIADRLMSEGKINLEIFKSRFRGYSENVFYIIQELVKNAKFTEITGWPRFMYSYVDRGFAESHNLTESDLKEGCDIYIGTYGKTLTDVPWGFILYPQPNGGVKVSLRSRPGGVNVRIWAESMGIGGGHNGASGMNILPSDEEKLEPIEQLEQLFEWMRQNPAPAYISD